MVYQARKHPVRTLVNVVGGLAALFVIYKSFGVLLICAIIAFLVLVWIDTYHNDEGE